MMKKTTISLSLMCALILSACGPAAEDREQMHRRAKQISDSMANLIKSAMQEAEMPAVNMVRPDTASAANTTSAAATSSNNNATK